MKRIPVTERKPRRIRLTLDVDEWLYEQIEQAARKERRPKAKVMREAIARYLREEELGE